MAENEVNYRIKCDKMGVLVFNVKFACIFIHKATVTHQGVVAEACRYEILCESSKDNSR